MDPPHSLNSDGTVPPRTTPGLAVWDTMRYTWRGVATLRLRNVDATLGTVLSPHITEFDPRLNLVASTITVVISAGKMEATATGMTAVAYAPAPSAGKSTHCSLSKPQHASNCLCCCLVSACHAPCE